MQEHIIPGWRQPYLLQLTQFTPGHDIITAIKKYRLITVKTSKEQLLLKTLNGPLSEDLSRRAATMAPLRGRGACMDPGSYHQPRRACDDESNMYILGVESSHNHMISDPFSTS